MTTIPQLTKELEEAYKDIRYYKNRIENLNGKLQQKENIIKEVRELLKNDYFEDGSFKNEEKVFDLLDKEK